MRLTTSFVAPGLALAAVLAIAACKDTTTNSCGSGTAPSVAGTYKLISYTAGGNTVDTLMGASGQLRFYATTYGFNATLPVVGALADSGNYVISGTKCMTETSLMGQGSTTGTFTLSGTTPGSVFTFTGTNTLAGAIGVAGLRQ
ncbi:MAG TPA: hypothetical protein VMT21_12645 [Gemmatimonadales bacterium]|nr:hypothetical protein [Gemmatimonadales bacterium]